MRNRIALCGLAMVALGLPAVTYAQSPYVSMVADGRLSQTVGIPAAGQRCFYFQGVAGRAYSVEVESVFAEGGYTAFMGGPGAVCPAADAAGLTDTSLNDPGYVAPSYGRRVSFVAPSTNYYMMTVNNTSGGTTNWRGSVTDTTQFSPAWSTNGSYDTFYSLHNTTSATCTGTLTLRNTAGTVVTTAAISVAPGATTATNTSALGTVRNTSGTARLTHNCPAGGILPEAAIANFTITPTPYFQFVHFQSVRGPIL